MADNLILFFSREGQNYVGGEIRELARGNTALCAEYIQKAVGGDLFRVEPAKEYAADYRTCTEEAKAELRRRARPALKAYLNDISGYKNIFVCGPCWWGTFPMPVFSLLERLDFTGKRVFPLMTHEGSGLGSCERDLKRACRGATLGRGLAVPGSDAPNAEALVAAWAGRSV